MEARGRLRASLASAMYAVQKRSAWVLRVEVSNAEERERAAGRNAETSAAEELRSSESVK